MLNGHRLDHRALPAIVTQPGSARPPPGESVTLPTTPRTSLPYLRDASSGNDHASSSANHNLPPQYDSVRTPSLEARGQAERNRQKQLIRDRQTGVRQDGWGAAGSSQPAPYYPQPPHSVEPSRWDGSERSASPSDGRNELYGRGRRPAATDPFRSNSSFLDRQASEMATPGHARPSSISTARSGDRPYLGDPSILPQGMSISQALAECHDPRLGWPLRFWVTVADPTVRAGLFTSPSLSTNEAPQTLATFFACPSTGTRRVPPVPEDSGA